MNFKEIKEIKDKIFEGYDISREEAIELSKTENIEALYYSSNQIRAKFCGSKFEMCSVFNDIIENCEEDCKFCPLSRISKVDYTKYETVEIEKQFEIINEINKKGVSKIEIGINHKTLTDNQLDYIIKHINEISSRSNVSICASFGALNYQQLEKLKKETKVKRYHCNIETSENFYKNICTTINQNDKYETLKNAKKLGFEICSGVVFGLGETMEDRIDMALKMRELGIKSISLNILFPFAGTPLEKQPRLGNQEILTSFAIFRFINPKAEIRFARGRSLIKIIEKEALRAGINSSMVGELLVTAKSDDIEYDRKKFEEEGFKIYQPESKR